MAKKTSPAAGLTKRPPVVVIMGHIDHGKSTLLDYIRKTNIVDTEAGGITQHLSAYEITHQTAEGSTERITFLDTPGHAAFQKMRVRGASVADIAVLIVSAEDGVKPQTLEAYAAIKAAEIPFVVAINKVDKPAADILRTQTSLIEHEIYIEGMGGDIPWVGISAKTGAGISDLLDLIVLSSDLAGFTADSSNAGSGIVIEGALDPKRGNSATVIIKDGSLRSGEYIIAGEFIAPIRIMEDAYGKSIKEATFSAPVRIVGFSGVPAVGSAFTTAKTKKAAEELASKPAAAVLSFPKTDKPVIPILIKADVQGTIEAIEHELEGIKSERITVRTIGRGVGPITDSDVQAVSATKDAIIVGFNVKVERSAKDLAERLGVEIDTFSVIYELSEWLNSALKNRTPKLEERVLTGRIKLLKHFSTQKHTHVLGGRVEEGHIKVGESVRILRRDLEIGKGVLKNLQQHKSDVQRIDEGEFGMQLDTKTEIAPGDVLEAFETIIT